jgi:hypothetical protein
MHCGSEDQQIQPCICMDAIEDFVLKLNKAAVVSFLAAVSFAVCSCGSSASSSSESVQGASNADGEAISGLSLTTDESQSTDPAASDKSENERDVSGGSIVTNLSQIDMTAWLYNADDDVYYQTGIRYAENSPDENYDSLAVFVPGAYFDATGNGDGTYTCALNTAAEVAGYSAATAPIVFPINTPGYMAQEELTDYTDVSEYTDAGFVYVHVGARGRDEGAPAGVTDFKAAIRYIRYNDGVIAGNCDRIFTFGMSGGGAQSAILGATGDSGMYDAYLEDIGAVQGVSDAVDGAMCWCPITNLDESDEAYEWNLGVTRTDLTDEEQSISDELAKAYAEYVNQEGFTDENGNVLALEESDEGIYQAGSYYDYIKTVIETSLNNFLSDTEFPYDASSASAGGMGGGMPGGAAPDGAAPDGEKPDGAPDGAAPDGEAPAGEKPDGDTSGNDTSSEGESTAQGTVTDAMNNSEANDNIQRNQTSSGLDLSGTYETAQDYIDALNADGEWVTYDAETNTATITSVADFVKALKNASKNLGAFDQLDAGQGENTLFGYGDGNGAHFDATLAQILKDLGSDYAEDYETDLAKTDSLGNTVEYRLEMYSPLYFLMESEDGYQTSTVAKHWRIRTGIDQGDTALCTEVNLALALEAYDGVEDVDFATVWGLGHTMAERTGDADTNFIDWVNDCVAEE